MIVYHGTTNRRAKRICVDGFLPRKPSRRVWFATGRGYALRRAKVQARRAHDRAVVLTCEIDLGLVRQRLGPKRVFVRHGVIAVDGQMPVSVLRSHPSSEFATSPKEFARWVNRLLGLRSYKGVGQRHPGIERLSRWVMNRLTTQPGRKVAPGELLPLARQWLPEFFEGVEIDPEQLRGHSRVQTIDVEAHAPVRQGDPREAEALDLLDASSPRRRARGLSILAEIEDPDLSDWCMMFLDDESTDVRIAALHAMLHCRQADPEVIVPLTESENKRIRAAAIAALAALAKHSGKAATEWFARGLKDPSPCVRLATASLLTELDPAEHRMVFELALYDPNPQIVHLAQKLTAGKGYAKLTW